MSSKIKALTIILILVSVYLVYLSVAEYRTASFWEKFADEQFEIHLKETPAFPIDYMSMTQAERDEWENENTIKKLQYQIKDNENMDRHILWGIRAKIHFQMALLSILLTIISWRFDLLNYTKKR
jgi:hypothetical protein